MGIPAKPTRLRGAVLVLLLAGFAGIAHAAAPRDVMLVLDNSGSMRANDPARLSVSAVTDFIRDQTTDTRVGIVTFAATPTLVKPLTPVMPGERERLLGGLDNLDFSGQWTETAAAVERALYELRVNGRENAGKAIILMTDGIIDTGNTARDLEKARWLRNRLTEQAREQGVRIFGIAFTENADYELLQSVSQATDGEYFRALRAQDIGLVMERIDALLARSIRPDAQEEEAFVTAPEPESQTAVEPDREAERLVYAPPQETQALPPPQPEAADPDIENRDVTPAADPESPWRMILIVAALIVLGAVGVGILWGDELSRLWQRRGGLLREPEDHGPKAVLYDVYDPSDIKRHELGAKPVVIGRVSGSDPAMDYVVVDERTVGRWHATIERRGQSFWIRDEGSVNGTFVNDQRVTAEHPLKHGDMVRVHRHEFEFVIPELFDSDRTMLSPEAKMKGPNAAVEGV